MDTDTMDTDLDTWPNRGPMIRPATPEIADDPPYAAPNRTSGYAVYIPSSYTRNLQSQNQNQSQSQNQALSQRRNDSWRFIQLSRPAAEQTPDQSPQSTPRVRMNHIASADSPRSLSHESDAEVPVMRLPPPSPEESLVAESPQTRPGLPVALPSVRLDFDPPTAAADYARDSPRPSPTPSPSASASATVTESDPYSRTNGNPMMRAASPPFYGAQTSAFQPPNTGHFDYSAHPSQGVGNDAYQYHNDRGLYPTQSGISAHGPIYQPQGHSAASSTSSYQPSPRVQNAFVVPVHISRHFPPQMPSYDHHPDPEQDPEPMARPVHVSQGSIRHGIKAEAEPEVAVSQPNMMSYQSFRARSIQHKSPSSVASASKAPAGPVAGVMTMSFIPKVHQRLFWWSWGMQMFLYGFVWFSFAPIHDRFDDLYSASAFDTDLASILHVLAYILVIPFGSYGCTYTQYDVVVVVSLIGHATCVILRFMLGGGSSKFWIDFIAQSISAICSVFVLDGHLKASSLWLGSDKTTKVGTAFSFSLTFVGIGASFALSHYLTKSDSDLKKWFTIQLVIVGLVSLSNIILIMHRRLYSFPVESTWRMDTNYKEYSVFMRQKKTLKSTIIFSVNFSVVMSFLILLNEILLGDERHHDIAWKLGLIFCIAAFISSVMVSYAAGNLDVIRWLNFFCILVFSVALLWFILVRKNASRIHIQVCVGFMGFFGAAALPSLEVRQFETRGAVSERFTITLLWSFASVMTAGIVLIFNAVKKSHTMENSVDIILWLMFGLLCLGSLLSYFSRSETSLRPVISNRNLQNHRPSGYLSRTLSMASIHNATQSNEDHSGGTVAKNLKAPPFLAVNPSIQQHHLQNTDPNPNSNSNSNPISITTRTHNPYAHEDGRTVVRIDTTSPPNQDGTYEGFADPHQSQFYQPTDFADFHETRGAGVRHTGVFSSTQGDYYASRDVVQSHEAVISPSISPIRASQEASGRVNPIASSGGRTNPLLGRIPGPGHQQQQQQHEPSRYLVPGSF